LRRIGGTRDIRVDLTIIAATNCDIKDLVSKKLFREDLYHRLNVINIEIRKEFKCDGTFFVDYELIEQVILNILLNGIESMDKYPGKISIQTFKNNGFVSIIISDNGSGIDERDTDKIFQPFYSTKDKGTGLGLTISSRIIENHLGEILIDSNKGSGTSFTLKIPSDLSESGDMLN